MNEESLSRILGELQQEEAKLQTRKETLQMELHSIESDLQRLSAGMLALAGKPASTKSKKSKPSPNKEIVRKAIYTCLAKGGPIGINELKSGVGELLTQHGFSRMGLSLRIREVLTGDEKIVDSQSGYELVVKQRTRQAVAPS